MTRPEVDRDTCYLCGDPHKELLQKHHIVPQRYNGPDEDSNLVELCPTCHRKIERLYNVTFYDYLESYYYEDVCVDDTGSETSVSAVATDGGSTASTEISYTRSAINSTEYNPSEWSSVTEAVAIISKNEDHNRGAPIDAVVSLYNAPNEHVKEEIEKLRTKGKVYEPEDGHLRSI